MGSVHTSKCVAGDGETFSKVSGEPGGQRCGSFWIVWTSTSWLTAGFGRMTSQNCLLVIQECTQARGPTVARLNSNRSVVTAIVLAGALLLVSGTFDRTVHSYQAAAAPITKWEYRTTTLHAIDLQKTLDQFGSDGWEVFQIGRYESKLIQESGENAIRVTQFEVTGKRPLR